MTRNKEKFIYFTIINGGDNAKEKVVGKGISKHPYYFIDYVSPVKGLRHDLLSIS